MNKEMGWQAESTAGTVAAGGAEAVAAGITMLREGGNAIDAGAATIMALMVTDHGECSIGGEVPILIYDAQRGEVKALSGMGSAPRSQEAIDWYMRHGIPGAGNMKIAPVPSVVDAVCTALQRYGTMPFEQIIAPSLDLLDKGTAEWHPRLAVTLRRMVAEERSSQGEREQKIQAACDLFYGRGKPSPIADELEAFYIEKGGFLRKSDLAKHQTFIEDPVSVEYRGYTVYKCGPWTQGPVLCQALRLLEGYDLKALGRHSAEYIHLVIEALKLALADRDVYYGDPNFVDVPLAALFSEEYNRLRRGLIDPQAASREVRPGDPIAMKAVSGGWTRQPMVGGTTTCVTADRWGNMLAATPSANVMPGRHEGGQAGVTFGNRLRSFNTTPGHPNCIQAGKRPRITLTPTLVLKDRQPVLAVSVAGGDLQDQVTLKLLLDHIEFGLAPAKAVVGLRFATAHHQDSFDPNPKREETFLKAASLIINSGASAGLRSELLRRGHVLEERCEVIGHPVMLWRNPETGELQAAGDPLAGRHAAAMDE